jgi:hypothetical protein
MNSLKTITPAHRYYTVPEIRIKPLTIQKGLCISGGLSPIEEEDAGIDNWGK